MMMLSLVTGLRELSVSDDRFVDDDDCVEQCHQ